MTARRRNRLLPLAGLAVALLAGVAVSALATNLFPYLSVNNDEGVYLLQASMLLEGDLFLYPGPLADVVRPWFFVVADAPPSLGGVEMYSKYSPVAPAVFGAAKALTGDFDVALGVVATGNVALVYALTTQAFDRETGALATVVLLGSPLFLLTSSTFLSYAPTTFFNLLFGFAYVRATRRDSLPWAALAGVAVGVAFFARPYTAVLFALPFVLHSLVVLWRASRVDAFAPTLRRYLVVAALGLAFVGVTLGYNALVTGDPLLFPYAAFAPRDGLGFGHRQLLGYAVDYTPALAAETTVRLLRRFATEWTTAGVVGTAFFLVGFGVSLRRAVGKRGRNAGPSPLSKRGRAVARMPERDVRLVFAGLVASVVLGNAYFWGTLNGFRNQLIDLLGPYYHFDLLLPLSAFTAFGALAVGRTALRTAQARFSAAEVRGLVVVALVVSAPVVAVAEAQVLSEPISANDERTETLAATYEPLVETEFDDAVVFVPGPYGDWQQHPFQYLRNDPGFDGDVLYVLDEGPERDVRTLDAAGNRTPYRFTYRGEWAAATEPVTPHLRRLRVLDGNRVAATSTLGVPARASSATVRIETEEGYARYAVDDVDANGSMAVEWSISPAGARVTNLPLASGSGRVSVPAGASEVDLVTTFVTQSGATVTYRQEATVEASGGGIRVVWPPETRVCRLTTTCGREGTYVGPDGEYVSGVSVSTAARAVNESA